MRSSAEGAGCKARLAPLNIVTPILFMIGCCEGCNADELRSEDGLDLPDVDRVKWITGGKSMSHWSDRYVCCRMSSRHTYVVDTPSRHTYLLWSRVTARTALHRRPSCYGAAWRFAQLLLWSRVAVRTAL